MNNISIVGILMSIINAAAIQGSKMGGDETTIAYEYNSVVALSGRFNCKFHSVTEEEWVSIVNILTDTYKNTNMEIDLNPIEGEKAIIISSSGRLFN